MPLPLIKLGIVVVRTFARPFNVVLTRRLKHKPHPREETFYFWFGMKMFSFENKIELMINQH